MTRAALFRLIAAILVVAGAVSVTVMGQPRLGLDLRGGVQIVLETQDGPTVKANRESTDRALEVLRGRVDALGVAEPTLTRAGEDRIIVELPGLKNPTQAAKVIGKTAQLGFYPVVGVAEPGQKPKDGQQILPDESGQGLVLGDLAVPGDLVSGSDPNNDPTQGSGWFVTVDFKGQKGSNGWQRLTAKAACAPEGSPERRVAIVLDKEVISSPAVVPDIACNVGMTGGSTQITGDFTTEEARELSVLIEGGALPVPVEIIEQRSIGPTLGDQAIDASAKAALLGLLLTGLLIVFVYRLMGFLATIALAIYAVIAYAILVSLGATLTLPGLAGFVLAIGMAIDANVLVFERAREEQAEAPNRSLLNSLTIGFNKAWSAIIDSNMTTLLAAALLFILSSGPVKGFGVTLSIGVLASMFSGLIVARVLTEQAARMGWVRRHPKTSGIADMGSVRAALRRRNPDLMSKSKLWLTVSAGALVLAVTGIFVQGLNLGVEFTGGRLMEYSTSKPVTLSEVRTVVADAGFPTAVVQQSGEDNVAVRTGPISNDEQADITDAIEGLGVTTAVERDELIGPSLGDELQRNALIAFGVALLAQMIYLAFRFKWTIGASAVLAMFHDVILVLGFFAWLGKPIDGIFLAAALTIVGLSVNDSVVVFDRIRERWRSAGTRTLPSVANEALLDTMPRTVNTGAGTMFILAALAVFGGSSLQDFAIALLLGLLIGTYSSVFTATPLLLAFHQRWPLPKNERVKKKTPIRGPQDSGAVL